MIRLAAVVDTFDIGGFEMACLELLRRLDRERFEPSIYTFRPGALVEVARADGIPVVVGHDKPAQDRTWRARDSRAREAWTPALSAMLARDRTDLCFVWGWPEAIPAALAAHVSAIVERVDGPALAARVSDKSSCTRVICESQHVRMLLLAQRQRFGLVPSRVVVIPNGVDLQRFDPAAVDREGARAALGVPADALVFGSLSRLSPEKNVAQLIAAFAAAFADEPETADCARLVLAGPDGGSRAALELQARRAGIAGRVVFSGPVTDTPAVLAALDVFCLTSYTEGTPAAVLEAMAMGLPIIATPVGAVPEMLDGNAILVNVLAHAETSSAMRELARDGRLRRRMGARSRVLAKRWSMSSHVERYENVLASAWAEATAA